MGCRRIQKYGLLSTVSFCTPLSLTNSSNACIKHIPSGCSSFLNLELNISLICSGVGISSLISNSLNIFCISDPYLCRSALISVADCLSLLGCQAPPSGKSKSVGHKVHNTNAPARYQQLLHASSRETWVRIIRGYTYIWSRWV